MAVDLIPNFDATKINQQNACVASYVGLSCHLLSKVAKKCSPQVNIFSCLLLSRLEFFCCFYVSLAGVLSHGRWSERFFSCRTSGNVEPLETKRFERRWDRPDDILQKVHRWREWQRQVSGWVHTPRARTICSVSTQGQWRAQKKEISQRNRRSYPNDKQAGGQSWALRLSGCNKVKAMPRAFARATTSTHYDKYLILRRLSTVNSAFLWQPVQRPNTHSIESRSDLSAINPGCIMRPRGARLLPSHDNTLSC